MHVQFTNIVITHSLLTYELYNFNFSMNHLFFKLTNKQYFIYYEICVVNGKRL